MGRSAALLSVGLWLGGLLASWVAASVNFRTVDQVLGSGQRPELAEKLKGVDEADRRMLLRHLASEINRFMFSRWWLAQAVLGLVLLAAVWTVGGSARSFAIAVLLLVLAQGLLVVPITSLGRAIDFVARPLPPATARHFSLLHAAYVGSDLLKAALLAAAAWLLSRRV